MVPNFILGGAMKSGTTFLHNLLENHSKIKFIDRDMIYSYFDDDRIYAKGKDWYMKLFTEVLKTSDNDTIIGQTSADCYFNPGSIERVLEHNPDTKLIFVLRHPIERSYSLYWHQYALGREFRRFEEAIALEPKLIKKSYHHFKHYSYLERSRYKSQFDAILKLVPAENVLMLDFDALIKNTKPTINVILDFLGIDPINDLNELNHDSLPRNAARIPTKHSVVVVSAYLQKLGLVGAGRRLIGLFREEARPPKINAETQKSLEKELSEDIAFYEKVKKDFKIQTENFKPSTSENRV